MEFEGSYIDAHLTPDKLVAAAQFFADLMRDAMLTDLLRVVCEQRRRATIDTPFVPTTPLL